MSSLAHESCSKVVLVLWTVIQFQQSSSQNLLHGSRLGTFPRPDFRTNFTLSANRGAMSFREIRHGLKIDPFYVRVYARPKDGQNSGFCFTGVGSSQSSPLRSSYGGLIYAYNSEFVRIWAPTNQNGHIVFVKDGWGGEVNTQESNEAEVVVEVWKQGRPPTFRVENVMGTQTNTTEVFLKVQHNLRQRPERVVVRLSPVDDFDNETNPNGGFWFHALGASQNPDTSGNFGGVIFAYNEKYVRLWAPSRGNVNSGCIFIGREWGGGIYTQTVAKCRVEILIWVNQLPTPTFQSEWFDFEGQRDQNSFKEIYHGLNELPAFVNVQLRAVSGRNLDYVFEAQGATHTDDNGTNQYGGVVFAYDENRVRIWAPSKHDGSKKGYPLLVKHGWGGDSNLQSGNDNCLVRIVVYSSRCNGSRQLLYEGNKCVMTLYDSYTTKTSGWTKCSSICNNGTKTRSLTGCDVRRKKTVLKCDFENGMCSWSYSRQGGNALRWVLTNTATPEADTGPLWGHPKGSYYVYSDTRKAVPDQKATLTSPNTGGADKCLLRFYWNMYGSDVGTLEVFVNTKDPRRYRSKWVSSGWAMIGSQGDIFWRSAFVNLETFSRVYQVRFQHTLPEGNCNRDRNIPCTVCKNQRCPAANVAIDDIRLDCQIVQWEDKPEMCTKRTARRAGCEMIVNKPAVTGPAYSLQEVGGNVYVTAMGTKHDLIAIYEFEVMFAADYVVWKQTFAKKNTTNDVSFRIDDGDWLNWQLPYKGSHALWTQYYFQQFQLKPGVHRVSLRQVEYGFILGRLALVPAKINMWTDLGMQSRQIPDSLLTGFPLSSNPKPRFGRLHAQDAWCSSDHNQGYVYFQVKLPELAILSRISVQGGQDILQKENDYWIKSFRMKISLDGENYTWYRDTGGRKTFKANSDASTIVDHTLMFSALVRGIRVYPWAWHNWICLRLELYGFYMSSELCASAWPIQTSKPCVGDRNCGQNADCRRPQASAIRKQVRENDQASLFTNITGQDNLETCHCYQGFHGSSCEHFGCTPNPCLNGGSCSQINTTFSCTCQPGYHGNTCQHPCLSGYYGKNCTQQCQCSEHGSCGVATGHCSCKQGYHGIYCDQVCSQGYFGYNCAQRCQCKNGASCDRATGSCNCTLGWSGAVCDQPCPWNTWGVDCKLNCSCARSASVCDRFTGECICLRGYFGGNCEHPCPVGLYGHNCSSKCLCQLNSTCSGTDGTCICTQPGWTGVLCDKPCPGGYYGVNCAKMCKCKNRAACDPVNGTCTCTSGWSGLLCDKPCAQGWWGRNCSIGCSCINGALCNPVNGQCSCSSANGCLCSPGWTGDDCAEPCPAGTWGSNCGKLCSCQQHGVCHQANGSCYCLPGYMGSKCNDPCPQGTYGSSCRYKCSCRSSTSLGCHPVDGTCKCVPGYVGPHCDILCPAGHWGVNCSQSCLCVHGSCNQVSGNCTCDRGWEGLYCDQTCANCSRPCPSCYHGNGSCDTDTGHCSCFPGYQGSSCLETCPLGYYGDKCRQMCNCSNGGVCHHETGQCVCKPGWNGPQCSNACPSGSYGHNCSQFCSCVHGTCNTTDGSCSCDAGYHGYLCDRPCPRGRYGLRCSQKCQCRNEAVCDHVTGRCTCGAGWTGKVCEVACDVALSSHGIFGAACLERCICRPDVPCDAEHGTCLCPPGLQGPNCIEACPRGLYGVNCSHKCNCLNNGSCDHVLGTCTCKPGWSGANCTDHCPAGSFGLLCREKCECNAGVVDVTQYCDPVTGTCSCRPGYQGYRCQERCREGFFGKNCSQQCACANGGVCNSIDGTCSCPPGYHGTTCQLRCAFFRYGYNCNGTCQCVLAHTVSCDKVDGSCTCTIGHMGVFCENVCPEGWYGANCLQQCTCRNGAACDHVTGACTCPPGFKGRSCETSCNTSTFGHNCAQQCLCRNGASCNRFDGNCVCAAGFYGDQCTRECPGGRFGVGCQNNCDCNEANTKRCDKKTGACICHPGFKGGRCDEPCEDGFYGDECKKPCPGCSRHVIGACNKITGNCTCAPGYHDYYCLDDCPLDRYGLRCKNPCTCSVNELCHHINGTCLNMLRGKFSIIVDDSLEVLSSDVVRQRNIKRGLEKLMKIYFDLNTEVMNDNEGNFTQARLSLLDGNNSSSPGNTNPSDRVLPSKIPEVNGATVSASEKHEFMVRLLEFRTVIKENNGQATRVVCVLLDNYTVIDGHYVDEVLSRIPSEDVSRYLMVQYYTGKLHRGGGRSSSIAVHLPLIIGASVGFSLIIIMLALFAIMRRRHRQKSILGSYKKGKKDQLEIELQPWIGRSTGYLLAFDNPYYDVLAAMGLDDDVEEDYYNPLYDDVSLYSDSGGNTSEDSSHKDLSAMVIRT